MLEWKYSLVYPCTNLNLWPQIKFDDEKQLDREKASVNSPKLPSDPVDGPRSFPKLLKVNL
jgi:hypothetical protein